MPTMTGTRAAAVAAALIATPSFAQASWDHPNGDQARTSFARVVTAPAVRPSRIVPVGELQVGAGPVIAPDGTVFIGNLYGQVLAFHADGTSAWGQQLPAGEWVTASPVLGAEGSVYVISETQKPVDGSSEFVYELALNKFTDAGVPVYRVPFPQHTTLFRDSRGDANAPPTTMKVNGEEFVIAVAFYDGEWHLIAFAAPDGAVVADTVIVPDVGGPITTPGFCDSLPWWLPLCGFGFRVHSTPPPPCSDFSVCLPDGTGPPTPGVAVRQDRNGRSAFLVVTDGLQDTVGYVLDPAQGFIERFREHDAKRVVTTPPLITTDGHSAFATGTELVAVTGFVDPAIHPNNDARLVFAGPNPAPLSDIVTDRRTNVNAPLTQLADGRLVAVERAGTVSVFRRFGNQSQSVGIHLDGQSVASVAASCSYFYVGSAGAFTTFDNRTLRPVASVPWYGGGRVPPAIGPGGQVYAIASTAMFIFPPARAVTVGGTGCGPGEILGEP